MKNLKYLLIAAPLIAGSLATLPASAQTANLNGITGVTDKATCTYTQLIISGGNLDVTCTTAVNYTGGGGGGGGGGGSGPYSITALASPLGGGTFIASPQTGWTCTSASCTGTYATTAGALQIQASPASGYTFGSWNAGGPCAGQGQTCAIATSSLTTNVTLTATFTASGGCVGAGCGTVPTGCTAPPNWEGRTSLGAAGQSSIHYGKAGVIYSYPLPVGQGLISTTGHPATPPGINMEIALSQCPGDMTYYTTQAARYTKFGSLQTPCGGIYIPESGGMKWGATTPAWDAYCIVTSYSSTNTWYFNIRYNTGCDGGANCPIVYFWNQQ